MKDVPLHVVIAEWSELKILQHFTKSPQWLTASVLRAKRLAATR